MRRVQIWALLGAVVLGAVACGDSTGTGGPKTLVIVSGDGQGGPLGATLPQQLVVVVIGTDAKPYANAAVTWAVTSGAATVNPALVQSNASGVAATTVTLGNTLGPVTVTASVAGVTPAVFACVASDPTS